MKVVEIFTSIDGEGKRTGLITQFIRLYKCNIRCSYCDSLYACEGDNYEELTADEILAKLNPEIKSVTLTGGEPLIHPGVVKLLHDLDEAGYDVNVETNGTQDIDTFRYMNNVWFTVDYKCPSSKMESTMNLKVFDYQLREQDVLKFVVGTDEDLNRAYEIISKYNPKCSIYISPVFGYDPKKIVEFMIDKALYQCKVQVQLHKIIWEPDMRGV